MLTAPCNTNFVVHNVAFTNPDVRTLPNMLSTSFAVNKESVTGSISDWQETLSWRVYSMSYCKSKSVALYLILIMTKTRVPFLRVNTTYLMRELSSAIWQSKTLRGQTRQPAGPSTLSWGSDHTGDRPDTFVMLWGLARLHLQIHKPHTNNPMAKCSNMGLGQCTQLSVKGLRTKFNVYKKRKYLTYPGGGF